MLLFLKNLMLALRPPICDDHHQYGHHHQHKSYQLWLSAVDRQQIFWCRVKLWICTCLQSKQVSWWCRWYSVVMELVCFFWGGVYPTYLLNFFWSIYDPVAHEPLLLYHGDYIRVMIMVKVLLMLDPDYRSTWNCESPPGATMVILAVAQFAIS